MGITCTHVTIVCGCTSDICHLRWSMYHNFLLYKHKENQVQARKPIIKVELISLKENQSQKYFSTTLQS